MAEKLTNICIFNTFSFKLCTTLMKMLTWLQQLLLLKCLHTKCDCMFVHGAY